MKKKVSNLIVYTVIVLSACTVFFTSCRKDLNPIADVVDYESPLADFTYKVENSGDPFTYSFENKSTDYSTVRWEFGDDSTSTEVTPVHTFKTTGTYAVKLIVQNKEGGWAQKELVVKLNPDSLISMRSRVQSDNAIALDFTSILNPASYTWKADGVTLGTGSNVSLGVEAGNFKTVTLSALTPKGSMASVTRLVTNIGMVNDITNSGNFTVSKDNDGGPEAGEGSKKLIDGDKNSKFLVFNFGEGLWAQIEFYQSYKATVYTLTSGGDAPERDPVHWTISGSHDGLQWTVLDEREHQEFPNRGQTRTFVFNNTVNYEFYRLSVLENGEGSLFQLAEWRLLAIPSE